MAGMRHQPQGLLRLNKQSPLARDLVFAAVPGGPELISGVLPVRIGGASLAANEVGQAFATTSNTADGWYWPLPPNHPFYSIGATDTLFVAMKRTSAASFGNVFGVPYRSGTWAAPYYAYGFGQNGTSTAAQSSWATGSTARASAISPASFLDNNGPILALGYTRGSVVQWYKGLSPHGASSAASGIGVVPDFTNRQPPTLFNRSPSAVGEGTTGQAVVVLVWNRALSPAEWAAVSANPWQLFDDVASDDDEMIVSMAAIEALAAPLSPLGAASSQASTSGPGAIAQAHQLLGAASTQGATSPGATITQGHALAGAASSQASTSGVGVIGERHIAVGAPSFQSSTSTSGAILQFHRPQGAASTQGSTSPGRAAMQEIDGTPREVTSLTVSAPTYVLAGYGAMELDVEIEVTGGASTEVKFSALLGTIGPEGIYTAPMALGDEQKDYITITPVAGKSLAVTIEVTIRAGVFNSWGLPVSDQQKLLPVIWPELDEPTEAQAESGNYRKDRMKLRGLRIVIENPRGSLRKWWAADGARGATQMQFAYGYIAGTLGNDGDELDCTIGPSPLNAQAVYVVNQFIGGKFDEHKIMFGFASQSEAEAAYLGNYSYGWAGLESCVACSMDQLKRWISDGDKSRPLTANEISNEGMTMDKVLWDSANMPLHSNLDQVLYALRRDDADDGLLYDAVTLADVLDDAEGVLTFDALVVTHARLKQRMEIMQKVLDRTGKAVKVAAMQVSDPFTQRGTTNVAVIYELTDGQTVSVFFHNPDVTPKKITAADELVSWKWMLNKKDITVAVAPEKGRDLEPRTVAARIMALAEKNSARFAAANGKRAERMETIAGLQTELETKKATLAELEQQVEAAQAARDADGTGDPEPVNPDPNPQPEPQPEPEPAPAPTLDVDNIKGVIASADPMAGVPHGDNWVLMNAPRPLLGTETMSNGEFLAGRYYAAIDPADDMAAAYIAENVRLNASVVFIADEATQEIMALNSIDPEYLPAYMEMEEGERRSALRGKIERLHGLFIRQLKELAAKGVPVPDYWRRDVEAFAFNRPGFFGRALTIMGADLLRQHPAGTWSIAKLESGKFVAVFGLGDGWSYAAESDTIEQAHAAMLAHPDYIAATAPAPVPEASGNPFGLTDAEMVVLISLQSYAAAKRIANVMRDSGISKEQYDEAYRSLLGKPGFMNMGKITPDGTAIVRAFMPGMLANAKLEAMRPRFAAPAVDTEAEARAQEEAAAQAAREAEAAKAEAEAQAAREAEAEAQAEREAAAAQAAREAEEAEAAAKAAKEVQEAEEAADGDFLALAAEGKVDFYDRAVTDRLAELSRKYTDPEGAYLDMIMRAKIAAKNFIIAEFKKKVG